MKLSAAALQRHPSQSTLTRFIALCAWDKLVSLFNEAQRLSLRRSWKEFSRRRKMEGGTHKGGKVRDRRKLSKLVLNRCLRTAWTAKAGTDACALKWGVTKPTFAFIVRIQAKFLPNEDSTTRKVNKRPHASSLKRKAKACQKE
jgi:hypothetical protein